MPKIATVEFILRSVCVFEAEHKPAVEALQPHADTLKPYLLVHIKALHVPDETTHTKYSYHCLVMSNIMMTPLQFLYTSRNSASRATSSDLQHRHIII